MSFKAPSNAQFFKIFLEGKAEIFASIIRFTQKLISNPGWAPCAHPTRLSLADKNLGKTGDVQTYDLKPGWGKPNKTLGKSKPSLQNAPQPCKDCLFGGGQYFTWSWRVLLRLTLKARSQNLFGTTHADQIRWYHLHGWDTRIKPQKTETFMPAIASPKWKTPSCTCRVG